MTCFCFSPSSPPKKPTHLLLNFFLSFVQS
nr:MAG TPA: hypothetical protein [Caudoviricetes sp.]